MVIYPNRMFSAKQLHSFRNNSVELCRKYVCNLFQCFCLFLIKYDKTIKKNCLVKKKKKKTICLILDLATRMECYFSFCSYRTQDHVHVSVVAKTICLLL